MRFALLLLTIGLWFTHFPALGVVSSQAQTSLALKSGLSCEGHAWGDLSNSLLPIILFVHGTGAYRISESGQGYLNALAAENKAVLVGFEKPGITSTGISVEQFQAHKQSDLVECARLALNWVTQANKSRGRVILVGHSEGVEILTRLWSQLVAENHTVRSQIAGLIASGIPLESWKVRLERSLEQAEADVRKEFEVAWKNRDEEYFLQKSIGQIPLGYLQEVISLPSTESLLRELIESEVTAQVQIFHGEKDVRCAVAPVARVAAWAADPAHGTSSRVVVRTFANRGHDLGSESYREMLFSVQQLINGFKE